MQLQMTEKTSHKQEISSSEPPQTAERMEAFLHSLSTKFDPEFAEKAAQQLSMAAEIVEASQGIRPSARAPQQSPTEQERPAPVPPGLEVHSAPGELRIVNYGPSRIRADINYGPYEARANEFYVLPTFRLPRRPTDLVFPELRAEADAQAVQQIGVLSALSLIVASTALMLFGTLIGLAGMYIGLATFFASQVAARQVGGHRSIVPPDLAAVGFVGSIGLAITAAAAAAV